MFCFSGKLLRASLQRKCLNFGGHLSLHTARHTDPYWAPLLELLCLVL
jgi:hypothetical protein